MKRFRNGELWEFEAKMPRRTDGTQVILGVDGGATSTVCVCIAVPSSDLFLEPPPLLGRSVGGCSNYNSVGEEAAKGAIEQVLAETLMKACCHRSSVQAVCLGVSGVDHPSDREHILHWLRETFPSCVELFVHNDSVAALASGTLGRLYGCVLIAGTGTIAYGFTEDGREARAAGAGPLLGDEGSGYSIAQQALVAVMRAHDGRGPPTILTSAILKRLQLSSPNEIIGWAYSDSSWARIAAIVPTVKACAAAGDTIANKVLNGAVDELVTSIKAVVKKLNLDGEDGTQPFPLVMVGGVLEIDEGWDLCKSLVSSVTQLFPGVQPILPKVEPAVGAAMLAWTLYLENSRRLIECNGTLAK